MKPVSIILLPDDLTNTIRILRIAQNNLTRIDALLSTTRTGEDGFPNATVRRYELAHYPDA